MLFYQRHILYQCLDTNILYSSPFVNTKFTANNQKNFYLKTQHNLIKINTYSYVSALLGTQLSPAS